MATQPKPFTQILLPLILFVALGIYATKLHKQSDPTNESTVKTQLDQLAKDIQANYLSLYKEQIQVLENFIITTKLSEEELKKKLEQVRSNAGFASLGLITSVRSTFVTTDGGFDLDAFNSQALLAKADHQGSLQWNADESQIQILYSKKLAAKDQKIMAIVDTVPLRSLLFFQSFISLLINPDGLVVASNVKDMENRFYSKNYDGVAPLLREQIGYPEEMPGLLFFDPFESEVNYGLPRYKVHKSPLKDGWLLVGLEKVQ